jgi:hypothetical protein
VIDPVFSDVMCRLQSSGDCPIPFTFRQFVHQYLGFVHHLPVVHNRANIQSHSAMFCVVHSTGCGSLACSLIRITSRRRQANTSYLCFRTPSQARKQRSHRPYTSQSRGEYLHYLSMMYMALLGNFRTSRDGHQGRKSAELPRDHTVQSYDWV